MDWSILRLHANARKKTTRIKAERLQKKLLPPLKSGRSGNIGREKAEDEKTMIDQAQEKTDLHRRRCEYRGRKRNAAGGV